MIVSSSNYWRSPTFQIEFSASLFDTSPENFLITTIENRSFVLNSHLANSKMQKKIKSHWQPVPREGRMGVADGFACALHSSLEKLL